MAPPLTADDRRELLRKAAMYEAAALAQGDLALREFASVLRSFATSAEPDAAAPTDARVPPLGGLAAA